MEEEEEAQGVDKEETEDKCPCGWIVVMVTVTRQANKVQITQPYAV